MNGYSVQKPAEFIASKKKKMPIFMKISGLICDFHMKILKEPTNIKWVQIETLYTQWGKNKSWNDYM